MKVYCLAKRKRENHYVPTLTPVPADLTRLQNVRGWNLYLGGKRFSHGRLGEDFQARLKEKGQTGFTLGGVVPCRDLGTSKKRAFRDLRKSAITLSWLDMEPLRTLGDVIGVDDGLTRVAVRAALISRLPELCKCCETLRDLRHINSLTFQVDERVTTDEAFLSRHGKVVYALVRSDVEICAATPGRPWHAWDARLD